MSYVERNWRTCCGQIHCSLAFCFVLWFTFPCTFPPYPAKTSLINTWHEKSLALPMAGPEKSWTLNKQQWLSLYYLFSPLSKHLDNFYWSYWVLGPWDQVLLGCPRQWMKWRQQGLLRVPNTPKAAGSPTGQPTGCTCPAAGQPTFRCTCHAHVYTLLVKVVTRPHLYQRRHAWYWHLHLILPSCS